VIVTPAFKIAFFPALIVAWAALPAEAADFYQIRGD
jgi:hypothetical protein